MSGKCNSARFRQVIKLSLTLLLAMSFSASAWAGPPEESQAPAQDGGAVYLPQVLKNGPLAESSGVLDPSFGGDGLVNTNLGSSDEYAWGVAVQADGKLVLAGYMVGSRSQDFALLRYQPDGHLDSGFGNGGIVVVDVAGWRDDRAFAVALQPDGKILAAGYAHNGENLDFALARFNPDGSLDPSFDGDGYLLTDLAGGEDAVYALALQADNKILVAGYASASSEDFGIARYNPDGSLDTSFSTDGVLLTDFFGGSDTALSVAIQPDGKLVVAGAADNGANTDFALARYHPDGSLDLAFAGDGMLVTDFSGTSDSAYAVILQPDGKMVLAGRVVGATGDFALARYLPDGGLDLAFSGDGLVVTDLSGDSGWAFDLSLQPDGKLLAAGSATVAGNRDFALLRYNPDGSLDSSFDGDGIAITDMSGGQDSGRAMALQTDGKIVVAGYSDGVSADFAAVRYNTNGSLDANFGNEGIVSTNLAGSADEGAAVVQQPDGKLVVAGSTYASGRDFALARYHPDGSLDGSFGDAGRVVTDFTGHWDEAYALALQPDGKIVVAGYSWISDNEDFALARYNADGSLDASFDGDGLVSTDLSGDHDRGSGLALQADGKIVLAGYAQGATRDFGIVRYNPDGSLDSSFSGDGIALTDFAGGDDKARGVALQADGKIVVAGWAHNGANQDCAVARYNPDGSLDNTFSADGLVMTDFSGDYDGGEAIALQPDGKIVVSGRVWMEPEDIAVVRYLPDGSLDTSFSGDGWAMVELMGPNTGGALALQANGKILVASCELVNYAPPEIIDYAIALVRFNPDGNLDASLDGDGVVITNFLGGSDCGSGIVVKPDGRIIVAGTMDNGMDSDFALVGYQ